MRALLWVPGAWAQLRVVRGGRAGVGAGRGGEAREMRGTVHGVELQRISRWWCSGPPLSRPPAPSATAPCLPTSTSMQRFHAATPPPSMYPHPTPQPPFAAALLALTRPHTLRPLAPVTLRARTAPYRRLAALWPVVLYAAAEARPLQQPAVGRAAPTVQRPHRLPLPGPVAQQLHGAAKQLQSQRLLSLWSCAASCNCNRN